MMNYKLYKNMIIINLAKNNYFLSFLLNLPKNPFLESLLDFS